MWYVYIFEDGNLAASQDKPTATDLMCVLEGILTIIAFTPEGPKEFDNTGALVAIKPTSLESTFHVPSSGV
jgi:hypothetical protein